MRLTAFPSTGGSSRSTSMARSTIGPTSLRRSTTIHSSETSAEKVTGALDSHLERRLPDAGDPLDLLVRETLEVVQEEDLAVVFRDFGQRAADLVSPLLVEGRVGPVGRRERPQHLFIGDVDGVAALLENVRGTAAVAEDAEEPGVEALPLLISREGTVEPHERLLDDVVRLGPIAEHAESEAHAAGEVAFDDLLERLDVTQLCAIDERRIDDGPCRIAVGQRCEDG